MIFMNYLLNNLFRSCFPASQEKTLLNKINYAFPQISKAIILS